MNASRPEPRKSALSGSSPVRPVADQYVAPPATPAEPAPAASTPAPKASKYPPKVSFYQDPADTERVRGAVLHTMIQEGHRNMSQFLSRAVMKEVERLEAQYNNGKPFPAVSAKELPQGRPMGE